MNVCILQMIYFDRFWKELMLIKQVHLSYCFKFQPSFCKRCHDLLMMSMNLSDIAILNIKGSYYPCIIRLITKKETINLL